MKLGDDKEIQVDGEKIVAINTTPGKTKLFHNVQYVPSLAHNLFKCRAIDAQWIFSSVFQQSMLH